MNNYLKGYLATLFLVMIFIVGCDNSSEPEKYHPDAMRVSGEYNTIEFKTPSKYDTEVDVINIGGYINIKLALDFRITGELHIPETPALGDSGFTEEFEGTYSVTNDSVKFHDLNNILSHPNMYFQIIGDSLNGSLGSGINSYVIIKFFKKKTH